MDSLRAWDCVIPDKNNKYNFLFDTHIYDKKLSKDFDVVMECQKKISNNYRFYITEVQFRELDGFPDRPQTYDDLSSYNPSKNKNEIQIIIFKLKIQKISCLGLLKHDFLKLDGTFRAIPYDKISTNPIGKMFWDIINKNYKKSNDAVIAEAAIYNNCILISNDIDLIKKVNKYFPNKALCYIDFINKYLDIKEQK